MSIIFFKCIGYGFMKMHEDEIEINEKIVKRLIDGQFSQFKDLPINKVNSMGTVNAIYKLGEEYCVRLPRLSWAGESLRREIQILPVLAKKSYSYHTGSYRKRRANR